MHEKSKRKRDKKNIRENKMQEKDQSPEDCLKQYNVRTSTHRMDNEEPDNYIAA